VILASLVCVHVPSALAQAPEQRPVAVGITGGGTLPLGDFNPVGHLGWNLGALAMIRSRTSRASIRFDAQWLHLTGVFAHLPGGPMDNETRFRIIDGTANAVYNFGTLLPPGELYVIGGAGLYFGHAESKDFPYEGSAVNVGLNAGAGVQIEGHGPTSFVELRYHYLVHGAKLLHDASSSGTKPLPMLLLTAGVLL
jgi:hypothetical protein